MSKVLEYTRKGIWLLGVKQICKKGRNWEKYGFLIYNIGFRYNILFSKK